MERNGDNEEEEDAEEEDQEEKDEKEEEDEDKKEDEDEDDGNEPRMIGKGAMVNSWADDVYTMANHLPTVLTEQGQKMCEHTPWPQPPTPATRPQTTERYPTRRTADTHPLGGLEVLMLVTPQTHRPVVPTRQEAEVARFTPDVDVDQ